MNNNRTYILSLDTLTTICKGALGGLTFGAYHQFNTNKMMELNNKYFNDKLEQQDKEIKQQDKEIKQQDREIKKYREEMNELREQIKSRWW